MPKFAVTLAKSYVVRETHEVEAPTEELAKTKAMLMDDEDEFFENPDNLFYDGVAVQSVEEVR